MNIRTLLKRGCDHKLACQDSLYFYEDENYIFASVFDGCSQVVDSHFASNLMKKTFKNEVEKQVELEKNRLQLHLSHNVEDPKSITEVAPEILSSFFKKLDLIRIELNLTVDDFNSTAIFLFYDKFYEQGIIYAFGDGVISINGELIVLDHDNKPHYFVLDWKKLVNGEGRMKEFFKEFKQIWTFDKIKNVIISTDGILSFRNDFALEHFFYDTQINNKEKIHQESFLEKKYNIAELNNWSHTDDLGIIRIHQNEEVSNDI